MQVAADTANQVLWDGDLKAWTGLGCTVALHHRVSA
jgi:hypothetical protein